MADLAPALVLDSTTIVTLYLVGTELLHYTLLAQTWVLPFGCFIPHCCQLKRTHGSNSGSPAKCVYVLNAGVGAVLRLKEKRKKVITVSKYFFLKNPTTCNRPYC